VVMTSGAETWELVNLSTVVNKSCVLFIFLFDNVRKNVGLFPPHIIVPFPSHARSL